MKHIDEYRDGARARELSAADAYTPEDREDRYEEWRARNLLYQNLPECLETATDDVDALPAFNCPVYKIDVSTRTAEEVLEQASRNYVHIDEVVVRHIELPKAVRDRIEAKLIEKETAEAYEYRLKIATAEAERLRIEAGGLATYNNLVGASLTPNVLQWEALQATKELAKSPNAKTIIIGRTGDGLPIILPPQ